MRIILYVSGMSFHGNTINEGKSLGGSESAGYYMARELKKLGYNVLVFSNILQEQAGNFEGVIYMPIGKCDEKTPFGSVFMDYAMNVPHDVLIAQRVPNLFSMRYNNKLNLWWTHDLALKRSYPLVHSQLWNVDSILAVSDWHKSQIKETYDIKNECIEVLPNGVDVTHYKEKLDVEKKFQSKTLVFSSRPERGLENLVRPDGIMEKLFLRDPEIKLIVTGYDHTAPHMAQFYNMLWGRCSELPNVQLYPPQSKQQLAVIEQNAMAQIYPTEFEETSCITAMHAQKAGNPFLAMKRGALEETLNKGSVIWVEGQDGQNKKVDVDKFVEAIIDLSTNFSIYQELHNTALKKADDFSWEESAKGLDKHIQKIFSSLTSNKKRMLEYYKYTSDINAAKELDSDILTDEYIINYDNVAEHEKKIKNDHFLGDDDHHLRMPRNRSIIELLNNRPEYTTVLDYGCCVGQITIALARLFPHINFVGVDISELNINTATEYVEKNKIPNISFFAASTPKVAAQKIGMEFDVVLCSQVLEHILDYHTFIVELEKMANKDGVMLFTTPVGPHEANRDEENRVGKEHLNHFEQDDIEDLFCKKKKLDVKYIPQELNKFDDRLGYFITSYIVDHEEPGKIDYLRKHNKQAPNQTLSVCILSKSTSYTLGKTLDSIKNIANEVIIGFDGTEGCGVNTAEIFKTQYFNVASPLEIGFDEARNKIIEKATMDWILWIDDDEVLQWPERAVKYLRNNQFDSYAIAQHHFSAEPAGLIKTDIPCRLFRNHCGIKFFGMVHEHPEFQLNEGCGKTFIIPQNILAITHNGYDTEKIRRDRFKRNWPLMKKDREKYPNRELANYLWIRDLVHMNRFEFEQTRIVSPAMHQRSQEGVDIWRKMVEEKKYRLVKDSIEYYNECVDMLTGGGGILYDIGLKANALGIGDHVNHDMKAIRARFLEKEDIEKFTLCLMKEKLDVLEGDYL